MTTVRLPEEDVLVCEEGATYALSWTNLSSSYLFDLRLDYALIMA